MADETDVEIAETRSGEAPVKRSPKRRSYSSARQVLAELVLTSVLPQGLDAKLKRKTVTAVIIEVPSAQWVDPVSALVKAMLPAAFVIAKTAKPGKYDGDDSTAQRLANGTPVVGVSQAPDAYLAPSLVSVADLRLLVTAPNLAMIKEVGRRCMRGNPGPDFDDLSVAGLDYDETCACFPSGAPIKTAVSKLRRAVAAKTMTANSVDIPSLEEASGYGAALVWANDLKRDVTDYRAGKIPWKDVDRGAVLAGKSGTGKSYFGQMLAKACGLPFVAASMGEFFATSSGYLDGVIKAQREAFARAAAMAPALFFIDELDALPSRAKLSPRGKDWWTPVINDFLILLDSAVSQRDGVIVVAATNRIEDIDEAILRPGRLERVIQIPPPDPAGLVGILRHYLKSDLADVDLLPLAYANPGATGAQAMEWARSARRTARRERRPMSYSDLARHMLAADNRTMAELERAAAHEAGHAVTSILLEVDIVERVTIVATSGSSGHTAYSRSMPDISTKNELERRAMSLLAGRAAEQALLGESKSTGAGGEAQSDLALATNLVAMWHVSLGMGDDLVWRGSPGEALLLLSRDTTLRITVDDDLKSLMSSTRRLVDAHIGCYRTVAQELLKERTLSGDRVREIVSTANTKSY